MIKQKISVTVLLSIFLVTVPASAQYPDLTNIRCGVDFSKKVRDWDGFGFNYVETAQTMDYGADPQEYGGFSLLDDTEKDLPPRHQKHQVLCSFLGVLGG